MILQVLSHVTSYLGVQNNYHVTNTNNVYNLLINLFNCIEKEEDKKKFHEHIKINMGENYYIGFKYYIFRKTPESELFKYLL